MIGRGTTVIVHGKTSATVESVHKGGKRLGVRYADGKTTFVAAAACKPAAGTGLWHFTPDENGGT